LQKEIDEGKFRLDLYHRLSVIEMKVPSLNERKEDIPLIAKSFLVEICNDYAIPEKEMEDDAMELLKNRNWTGNIRELRNIVERLIIMSGKTITASDVNDYVNTLNVSTGGIDFNKFSSLNQFTDYMITYVHRKCFRKRALDKYLKLLRNIGISVKMS
jgi:DNA-binding NtrC family response regulator